MERSLAFYRDLLGLAVVADARASGEDLDKIIGLAGTQLRFVELEIPERQLLELLEFSSPAGRNLSPGASAADVGSHHLALTVDDIHETYALLRSAGVSFTCEPVRIDTGYFADTWSAYCFDPDGLPVELSQKVRRE